MKKTLILLAIMLLPASAASWACTNLIAGRKATVDGSVLCTYNCDAFGFAGSMSNSLPGRHAPGEKISLNGWGTGNDLSIDQVEYTYNVVSLMNEFQVSIVETTFDGRLELVNEEGYLDYYSMMKLALERCTTARDAILCMANLVKEYGYNSSGETITVCDPQEAWIMEIIGKGPGRKGAVWVALRIPDDCICAHANISRIRKFPQAKKIDKKLGYGMVGDSVLYSADVISFAREMGFYDGPDADFSFRDAYCPIDFENVRYADARVWSFFRHHWGAESAAASAGSVASDAMFEDIDDYLAYIDGDFATCDHLPLWIKPAAPVSLKDFQADMRDHYEGTPLDMTADVSAGPWGMPIRPLPMHFTGSDGKEYYRERPIATQQSLMTMVCQMRSWLPNDIGGVLHFNCDDANMVAYVPVYCCIDRVPAPFLDENNPSREFNPDGAFWMNNFVANMIYPRYNLMIGDLRAAQKELEEFYAADQENVMAAIEGLTPKDRVRYLTAKSAEYADMMMKRWDKLAKTLIVKYNDQAVVGENGRLQHPGYDKTFIDAIGTVTGDRYLLDRVIERRER